MCWHLFADHSSDVGGPQMETSGGERGAAAGTDS